LPHRRPCLVDLDHASKTATNGLLRLGIVAKVKLSRWDITSLRRPEPAGRRTAMERRLQVRLAGLLGDAEVPAGLLRGVLPRLEAFLEPFTAALHIPEQQTNARHYVPGL